MCRTYPHRVVSRVGKLPRILTLAAVVSLALAEGAPRLRAQPAPSGESLVNAREIHGKRLHRIALRLNPDATEEMLARSVSSFFVDLKSKSPVLTEKLLNGGDSISDAEIDSRYDLFLRDNPQLMGKATAAENPRTRVAALLKKETRLAISDAERLALSDQFLDRLRDRNRTVYDSVIAGKIGSEELASRLTVFVADIQADGGSAKSDPASLALPAFVEAFVRANFGPISERPNSFSCRGEVEENGKIRKFVLFKKRPSKVRMHFLDGNIVNYIVGYDGNAPWSQAAGERPALMISSWGEDVALLGRYDPLIVGYRNRGAALSREGKITSGVISIRVTEPDGEASVSTIDEKTMTELSLVRIRPGKPHEETRFSDYRKVGVVNVPYKQEQWIDGKKRATTRLDEVVFDPGLIDAFFERPNSTTADFMQYMGFVWRSENANKLRVLPVDAPKTAKP